MPASGVLAIHRSEVSAVRPWGSSFGSLQLFVQALLDDVVECLVGERRLQGDVDTPLGYRQIQDALCRLDGLPAWQRAFLAGHAHKILRQWIGPSHYQMRAGFVQGRHSRFRPMSASPPILLQKSFCTGGWKFCGPPMCFSCKDVGGLIASR